MTEKTIISKREAVKETFVIPESDAASSITDDFAAASSSTDIHKLFAKFNHLFFWGKLNGVKLEWSNKMTRCAGICYSRPRRKYYCIRLSRPLLSQRPHSDLVETLLHEMIHAYLSVTRTREFESHGAKFHEHMNRINKAVGTNITVYHTFHKEVRSLKQHWWRCDGPCRNRRPYYGWVKRATNRAPGPWDAWWRSHGYRCGGRFVKVQEPIEYTRKRVHGLFGFGDSPTTLKLTLNNFSFEQMHIGETFRQENKGSFGHKSRNDLVDCPVCNKRMSEGLLSEHLKVCDELKKAFEEGSVIGGSGGRCFWNEYDTSTCPLCDKALLKTAIKEHLQKCDGLQGVFNCDNVGTTDNCPFCHNEVHGDLSSHIAGCLSNNILSVCEESDFTIGINKDRTITFCVFCEKPLDNVSLKYHIDNCEDVQRLLSDQIMEEDNDSRKSVTFVRGTKEEVRVERCLVCDQVLGECSLKDHLESCDGLQGIFDDDINLPDDDSDGEKNNNCNDLEHCPVCNINVANMSKHLSTCLNCYDELLCDEPNRIDTATNEKTATTNEVPRCIEAAAYSCPICGLEVNGNLNNHLERECLSKLDLSEVFDLPFVLRSSAKICRGEENHVEGNLMNYDSSGPDNINIVNGSCKYTDSCENKTNQRMLKVNSESLIYCRSCKKFYSMSYCPTCCK